MYVLVIKINYFDYNLLQNLARIPPNIKYILIVTKNKIKQTKPNDYSLLR